MCTLSSTCETSQVDLWTEQLLSASTSTVTPRVALTCSLVTPFRCLISDGEPGDWGKLKLKLEALSVTELQTEGRSVDGRSMLDLSLWLTSMVPQLQVVRRQSIEIPEIHNPRYLDFC